MLGSEWDVDYPGDDVAEGGVKLCWKFVAFVLICVGLVACFT